MEAAVQEESWSQAAPGSELNPVGESPVDAWSSLAGGAQTVFDRYKEIERLRNESLYTQAAPQENTPLQEGSRVVAGSVLGWIGGDSSAPHLKFELRPAGTQAARVDPRPILNGWKMLEQTGIFGSKDGQGLRARAAAPSVGQILLMTKEDLITQVLADQRITLQGCTREDVRTGQIDRRVLATLSFLAESGLHPTVSCLRCGHSYLTKSGNVSEHSSGNAVDISAINGIPIVGHQGGGSITEQTIRRLLTLQGSQTPHQIISHMKFGREGRLRC